MKVTSQAIDETEEWGRRLGRLLGPSDCITLRGDLGAGKTTLARALIRERAGDIIDVPSPTFTLVETYDFETPLFHIDLYRLDEPDQVIELGLDDLMETGITVIEWPEKASAYLPVHRLDIVLAHGDGDARRLEFEPRGEDWTRRVEAMLSGAAS